MNREQLKGALRMLEALIEVAEEEGDDSVPVEGIRKLHEKYSRYRDQAKS